MGPNAWIGLVRFLLGVLVWLDFSGKTELLQVVAAGLPGVVLNEQMMLPLGMSNGVCLYLDGGRFANFERSDVLLCWAVKQLKPKEKEPEAAGEELVEASGQPKKAAKKPKAKSKSTRQKEDPPVTHCLNWDLLEFDFKLLSSGKTLHFKFQKPSLHPEKNVPVEKRLKAELRRAPHVWPAELMEMLRPLYCKCLSIIIAPW